MTRLTKFAKGNVGQATGFGFATVIPRLAAIGLVPLLTAYLSKEEYGRFSLAESVAALLITFLGLGLPAAVVRTHSRPEKSWDQLMTLFVMIFLSTFFGLAMALLFGWVAWDHIPTALPFFPYVAVALGTVAVQQVLVSVQALNQSEKRAWRYAGIALLQTAAIIGFTIWFVMGGAGGLGVLQARLLGAVSATLLAIALMFKYLQGRPKAEYVHGLLLFAVPLVPHQLVAFVLNAGDRFVIDHFLGLEDVGLYSLAYGFGASMTLLTTVMMLLWAPRFYGNVDEQPKEIASSTRLWLVSMAAVCVAAMVAAPPVVRLLTAAQYHPAAATVPLIMAGYFFHAAFSLFGLQIMHDGKTGKIAKVTVFAALLNLGLNLALVPLIGMDGAAFATLATFVVEAVGIYWMAQHLLKLPHKAVSYVGIGVVVAIVAVTSWALSWNWALALGVLALIILWKTGLAEVWSERDTLLGRSV